MKKIALLLITLIVLSCSKNQPEDPFGNRLIVDYDVDFYLPNNPEIYFNDLTITNSNETYLLLNDRTTYNSLLYKVDAAGIKSNLLYNFGFTLGNGVNITSALNDKLFFNSDAGDSSNKIYSYDNVQLNNYTMKDNGPNLSNKARVVAMSRYSNNSIVAFDINNKTLKFYLPQDNLESTIAGSGSASIVDGSGLSASFKSISKIVCRDNKIYVIDDFINLRKIEYINNNYVVSTVISNFSHNIDDIAIDSNNDVYALSSGKGIYKLNKSNNTLEIYKSGATYIQPKDNNLATQIDWTNLANMYINESDLYVLNGARLIKISNFKSKI